LGIFVIIIIIIIVIIMCNQDLLMITINVMVRGTGRAVYSIHVLSDNPKLKPDMQGSDGSKRAGSETAVTEVT
jgi:hypothetical protein